MDSCYYRRMIALFTDYGWAGPYLGQVEAVLHRLLPGERIINLLADAPRNDPKASAYLLAAFSRACAAPPGTIFFAVVDPGVGSFQDRPVIINADGQWYVGPDNGLFDLVCRRSSEAQCWRIDWQPETLSASFHGRDLYAPTAAMIRKNEIPGAVVTWKDQHGWPDDLEEIVYIDHFGNCMTGVRAEMLENNRVIQVNGFTVSYADTFASVPRATAFWYRNSQELVEIAVNGDSAEEKLKLEIGVELVLQE